MRYRELSAYLDARQKPKTWKGEFWQHLEVKEDGHRLSLIKMDGKIHAIGRKIRLDIWRTLQEFDDVRRAAEHMPDNTMVDGELYVPRGTSSDVVPALKVRDPLLSFRGFSVPVIRGERSLMGYRESREVMRDWEFHVTKELQGFCSFDREMLLQHIRKIGCEGFVLKATANAGWYKLKLDRTVDAVVVGWEPGESRLEGLMGALRVAVWGQGPGGLTRGQGPGGQDDDIMARNTDPDRLEAISDDLEGQGARGQGSGEGQGARGQGSGEGQGQGSGDQLIEIARVGGGFSDADRRWTEAEVMGRVCEVRYDCVMARGRLRFPRFIQWRDDKPSNECTMEQLQG